MQKYMEKDSISFNTLKKYKEDTNFEIVNKYLDENQILVNKEENSITIKFPYFIVLTEVKFIFSLFPCTEIDFSLYYSHKHTQEISYLYFDHFPAMDLGFDSKYIFDHCKYAKEFCSEQINKDIFEWIDILLQHFFKNQFKELNRYK
jgi:hypothetical protein